MVRPVSCLWQRCVCTVLPLGQKRGVNLCWNVSPTILTCNNFSSIAQSSQFTGMGLVQKREGPPAIGCPCGGLSPRIHSTVDASGKPLGSDRRLRFGYHSRTSRDSNDLRHRSHGVIRPARSSGNDKESDNHLNDQNAYSPIVPNS